MFYPLAMPTSAAYLRNEARAVRALRRASVQVFRAGGR